MKRGLLSLIITFVVCSCAKREPLQYFFLNNYYSLYNYEQIENTFGHQEGKNPAVGKAILMYILERPVEEFSASLDKHFRMAEEYDIPVLVELDPITFWDGTPELWNWWDPSMPGYDEGNRENVEWTGWGAENAVKIGWLNWGRQIRLKPMANLFSPAYRAEVQKRMDILLKQTAHWYRSLPRNKKYLLGGVKITGELAFGVNNWYYPGGNELLSGNPADDPQTGLDKNDMPFRGVGPMGYASLSYSGIRTEGEITAEDIYRLEKEYAAWVADICKGHGLSRKLLFSHSGGWRGDLDAAVQQATCPSWSFYWGEAENPADSPQYKALLASDAPYWGLSEWNIGTDDYGRWKNALENCYSLPRCRFISLFNHDSIFHSNGTLNEGGIKAIKERQEKEK